LVWSSISASTMSWYAAVWDSLFSGAPFVDSDDFGRGNDYSEVAGEECYPNGVNQGYQTCDNSTNTYSLTSVSSNAYCKSLNEGGKTDWRLPTKGELNAVTSNGGSSHLYGTSSFYFWTSSTYISENWGAYVVRIQDNSTSRDHKYTGYKVMCVRGGKQPASQLTVVSGPSVIGTGTTSSTPLVVRVKDSSGNFINASGRTITITNTTAGTLGGTLSAVTDVSGKASISGFTLSTAGTATITISSSGLTSATYTITVRSGITADQHVCRAENSRFITQNGGCQDTTNHLVWSMPSPSILSWYQSIWDSVNLSGNAPADANDTTTNDYDTTAGYTTSSPYYDSSLVNYCHDLVQGGKSDWRVPTLNEYTNVGVGGAAGTYFDLNLLNQYFWTSSAYPNAAYAYVAQFTSSLYATSYVQRSNVANKVVCVRSQP